MEREKREGRRLTASAVEGYLGALALRERAEATLRKYRRSIEGFRRWLAGRAVTKALLLEWKGELLGAELAPSTVNGRLAALNGLFAHLGWSECRVRALRLQRRAFREDGRELTGADYRRLVEAARRQGREILALAMEAICSTGIRVSELRYLTVEAARQGRATISMKGKLRIILLPQKLCRKLLTYARAQKTAHGEIFLTGDGKRLSRFAVWRGMKALCERAGVEPRKVFPHNLRHLFATTYYKANRNLVHLADLLGHSSIETTRIYLLTSGEEHAREIEALGLLE